MNSTKFYTFDEFKALIEGVDYPAGRTGPFRVRIENFGRTYDFHSLKMSYSNCADITGFSLNHYGPLGLPSQKQKKSQFHDNEDVDVIIYRQDFRHALQLDDKRIKVRSATWNAIVTWP